jgi:hypothetical protein
MAPFSKVFGILLATSSVTAEPSLHRRGPLCTEFRIPVQASAPTKILSAPNLGVLSNPNNLIDYILAQSSTIANVGGAGSLLTEGTYGISVRYCAPEVYIASRADTIQYLQHAITNTKEYWNGLTFPAGYQGDTYSWIAYASKQGYATLSVDNLGSGDSDRPNGLLVTQMSLQVEIIHKIIQMLRQGSIPNAVLSGKSFNLVIYAGTFNTN